MFQRNDDVNYSVCVHDFICGLWWCTTAHFWWSWGPNCWHQINFWFTPENLTSIRWEGSPCTCHSSIQWGTLEGPGSRRIFIWRVIESDQDSLLWLLYVEPTLGTWSVVTHKRRGSFKKMKVFCDQFSLATGDSLRVQNNFFCQKEITRAQILCLYLGPTNNWRNTASQCALARADKAAVDWWLNPWVSCHLSHLRRQKIFLFFFFGFWIFCLEV